MSAKESLRRLQRPPLTDIPARLKLLVEEHDPQFTQYVVVRRNPDSGLIGTLYFGSIGSPAEGVGILALGLQAMGASDHQAVSNGPAPAG